MDTDREWIAAAQAGTLVIADRPQEASDAVTAGGLRLLGSVAWADAEARLGRQSAVDVVLAETDGAAEGLLERVLPRLSALAHDGDTRIVVALSPDRIDPVTAMLDGPGITLLCAPSPTEIVAALMLAAAADPSMRLHDIARERESARLQQLNAEVARIAETLARLTRGEPEANRAPRHDAVGDRPPAYAALPREPAIAIDVDAREIRDAIRARRLRDQMFGAGLFEDPAWDMLLDLFAAELEHAQVSVSSLCIAAAVAPTTALRWITRMTEAGLFKRQADPFDRRRAFMALSDRASAGMRSYIAALRRAGLSVA